MVPKTTDNSPETREKAEVFLRLDRALTTISEVYPDLAPVLEAWPTLAVDIKAALVAIAKANRSG